MHASARGKGSVNGGGKCAKSCDGLLGDRVEDALERVLLAAEEDLIQGNVSDVRSGLSSELVPDAREYEVVRYL